MLLNFAYRLTASVERNNLVNKTGPTRLVLGDELRLKTALMVTQDFDGQFAKLTLEDFMAFIIAGIARAVTDSGMFVMTKMLIHFSLQGAFNKLYGELFEKAILTN